MKTGKLGCTPLVLAACCDGSNRRRAHVEIRIPPHRAMAANGIAPVSAMSTPSEFTARATSNERSRIGRNPRKTGSHLALNPQTNGTRKPQVSSTRNRWSNAAGRSGERPCADRYTHAPKLASRVASKPTDATITTSTHFSRDCFPLSWGRWPETDEKKMRKAVSSSAADTGSNTRQCHWYTPVNQCIVTPAVQKAKHVHAPQRANGFKRLNFGIE